MTVFIFDKKELEAILKGSHNAGAKPQEEPKDLDDQDSKTSKSARKWYLVIVVSALTHEINYLDSSKAELEMVSEKEMQT